MRVCRYSWVTLTLLGGVLAAGQGLAQELEPRAYRTLPKGLNAFAVIGSYSRGNVLTDAASPLQDVELKTTAATFVFVRSFGLAGRSSSVTIAMPYLRMSGSGNLGGDFVSNSRSGAGFLRTRIAVNLLGGPALSSADFAKQKQGRNLGVSLSVATPTGQYDSSRVISFGANRWAFKPELGYSSIKGRWILEAARRSLAVHRQRRFLRWHGTESGSDRQLSGTSSATTSRTARGWRSTQLLLRAAVRRSMASIGSICSATPEWA